MRHGETLFNVKRKIQGWCDSPLTTKGIEQAIETREYFKEHNILFDHAYCSTSERCVDTLELILEGNMPYTRMKELKEMNYGIFEGESEDLNPKTTKAFESFYLPYGGESSNDVKDRMVNVLTEIMDIKTHENVLVVSHSGACFNFLRALQDPTDELEKGFPNCCIFVYEYENNKFSLVEVIRN